MGTIIVTAVQRESERKEKRIKPGEQATLDEHNRTVDRRNDYFWLKWIKEVESVILPGGDLLFQINDFIFIPSSIESNFNFPSP